MCITARCQDVEAGICEGDYPIWDAVHEFMTPAGCRPRTSSRLWCRVGPGGCRGAWPVGVVCVRPGLRSVRRQHRGRLLRVLLGGRAVIVACACGGCTDVHAGALHLGTHVACALPGSRVVHSVASDCDASDLRMGSCAGLAPSARVLEQGRRTPSQPAQHCPSCQAHDWHTSHQPKQLGALCGHCGKPLYQRHGCRLKRSPTLQSVLVTPGLEAATALTCPLAARRQQPLTRGSGRLPAARGRRQMWWGMARRTGARGVPRRGQGLQHRPAVHTPPPPPCPLAHTRVAQTCSASREGIVPHQLPLVLSLHAEKCAAPSCTSDNAARRTSTRLYTCNTEMWKHAAYRSCGGSCCWCAPSSLGAPTYSCMDNKCLL